jgi:hypothetical protein
MYTIMIRKPAVCTTLDTYKPEGYRPDKLCRTGRRKVMELHLVETVMLAQTIEAAIRPVPYRKWTVGVTDNPGRRCQEHGCPSIWQHWPTPNEQVGRYVESYLLKQGMRGDSGGGGHAGYVYVFREE